jgi:ketosteroid isomerase-like protein
MKNASYFLTSMIILLSCSQPDKGKKNDSSNKPDVSTDNIIVANTMFEKFNSHDWKGMAETYIDSAEFKDPSFGVNSVKQSHSQTIKKYTALNKYFPNIKDSIINIYAAGSEVVVAEFISVGTAQDGSKLFLPICSVLTIKNGKIVKDYTYYDNQ